MSDIRKTLDKLNEMTAGSVATVATPLFKETVKREKTDETTDSGKKYMNSVERGVSEWGNWAGSKKKKTVAEATNPTTDDDKFKTMLKKVTSKKEVKKQQKADTKQQASDAFASMFGGGNPAGTLGIRKEGVAEGAPELLKQEMPLVRHIEKELAQHGYKKGTPEYEQMFKHAMAMYRKFGNIDAIKQGVAEGLEQDYLSQIPNLSWKPVSRSVWNTIQDEGLDEEQNAPNHSDWLMASLSISPKDIQSLQAFDDNAIEDFNRFDIRLKSRYPGLTDLIDYDKGTVTIVKPIKRQGVAEGLDESWKISTPIDKERYTDMSDQGLEGPFRLKSGKIVYYDPKEGKYYDRDTDMYMDYDEYQSHTNEEALMELGYEGNIGAMEMVKFFKMADPRQKEILNQLIKEKEFQRAWALIQGVTGDKLVGKEFSEDEIAEQLSEDLRAWFGKGGEGGAGGGGWDRYNTKGERIGKCGERKAGEGKPKCLSKEKAASLRASGGKKAIAAAVRKKRREDPNPQRKGAADMVSNKTKNESLEYYVKEGICPQCNGEMVSEALFTEGKKDACYHKVKSRYKIWPSAYACVPEETSTALTRDGWKTVDELQIGEEILTYNMKNDVLEFKPILNLHRYHDVKTKIVKSGNTGFVFESTDKHKWVIKHPIVKSDRVNKYEKINGMSLMETTEMLENNLNKHLVVTAPYHGGKPLSQDQIFKYGTNWVKYILDISSEQRQSWLFSAIVYDGNQTKTERLTENKSNISDLDWVYSGNHGKQSFGFKQKDIEHRNAFLLSAFLNGGTVTYKEHNTKDIYSCYYVSNKRYKNLWNFRVVGENKTDVWCPETENNTWVMMQETNGNGIITITGNSGALVKCRKAGAKNWGKSKNESINEGRADDLERALMQARKITKGIAYDNTVNEIMVEIEELVKAYNLDMDDFNYHNNRVYEAKHELESSIYDLDEIFEDALRDAKFSDEEGLNEQDLIVMPGKMRMRGDVVKAKHMEPDHEVSMAVNSLLSTVKNAMSLAKIIKGRSERQGLPGWVSDHITRADELIKDVAEYMEGHEAQKNMLEGKKNVKR